MPVWVQGSETMDETTADRCIGLPRTRESNPSAGLHKEARKVGKSKQIKSITAYNTQDGMEITNGQFYNRIHTESQPAAIR